MNIKILGKSSNKLRVEFEDEDHTFLNLLRISLWEDENVKFSAYEKKHPFLDNPVLIIETKKETSTNALKRAAKNISNQMEGLKKEFQKVLKK